LLSRDRLGTRFRLECGDLLAGSRRPSLADASAAAALRPAIAFVAVRSSGILGARDRLVARLSRNPSCCERRCDPAGVVFAV
jgi:hypothetical protein